MSDNGAAEWPARLLEDIVTNSLFRRLVLEEAYSRYDAIKIGEYPDGSLYAKYRMLPDDASALAPGPKAN